MTKGSYRTITPLERPKDLASKPVLTDEEAAALEARIAKARTDERYYWDRGTRVVPGNRTSLIVDPPDGKIPPLIPLDGRPHLPREIRQRHGDSRGRWEGNTLVVDTSNFTGQTNFRGSAENLHLIERFTRVDAGTIAYEFTIDDPTTFTRPWTEAGKQGVDVR